MREGLLQPQDRLVVAAAVLATLAAILAPAVAGTVLGGAGRPDGPRPDPVLLLTERAQRALTELPYAYQVGRAVIVPVTVGDQVHWGGEVTQDRIEGMALPLGARGLVDYGQVAPPHLGASASGLGVEDSVLADMGPLFFACTRWPGEDDCSAALLLQHDEGYYFHRSGLGSDRFLQPGAPMEMLVFEVLASGGVERLVLGGVHGTTVEDVQLVLGHRRKVSAWTSTDHAIPGATVWWATVEELPVRVEARDGSGSLVAELGPPS